MTFYYFQITDQVNLSNVSLWELQNSLHCIKIFFAKKIKVNVSLETEILETIFFLLSETISGACFHPLHIHVKINSALPFVFI